MFRRNIPLKVCLKELLLSFLSEAFFQVENALKFFEEQPYLLDKLYIPIIVAVVSFGCMALCEFLEKKCKQKWISDFALGLSMIAGMAAAAIIAIV